MLPASASPPARPRPAAADDEDADADALYRAAERGILERLDILAVCRDLGVRIAGSPTAKGWLPVHAVGREDAQASAAVGIEGPVKGRSVDLGSGVRCSLWELAVLCGRFSDWRAARQHFADQVGVRLPPYTNSTAEQPCPVCTGRGACHWNAGA